MISDVMCMYTCMCMHVGHSDGVLTVAVSPDSKYIVSGSWDGSIKVWDLLSGREIHTLKGKPTMHEFTSLLCIDTQIFHKSCLISNYFYFY